MSVYHNIEKPLIDVISNMEIAGIKVDKKNLKNLSKEFEEEIIRLQKDIYLLSGEEFNINSPKQLGDILFENMKLPYKKKNKSGGFSTNSEVLEQLSDEGIKIAKLILKWREINKLKNTYTDSLILNINKDTERSILLSKWLEHKQEDYLLQTQTYKICLLKQKTEEKLENHSLLSKEVALCVLIIHKSN